MVHLSQCRCAQRGLPRAEISQRTNNTVRQLHLELLLKRSLFSMSSGQLQLIVIGSAYTQRPPIYLFDEPSAILAFMQLCG
ncbi:ATP-binding cassette domain-containing protein [Actinomyces trachealis]|uniref:ATP-binding cassette domain-containing protein n=1 Tax=Actinomyces trachealis TaxID=2763540 RepID=UPI001892CAE4